MSDGREHSNGVLSEGWVNSTIGEVFKVNPRKVPADALPSDAPVTFVPMPAVDADSGAITEPETREFADVRKGYTSFIENDVIVAKITPCMENGKAAIARGLTNCHGFGSSEFHVLRSTGAALPEYVYHFVRQQAFRREAESRMMGSVGQKRVPPTFLSEHELPLPPLAEQNRIVAKVEALLERVNKARERLDRVPDILKKFRQSVLAAACSGRLTADWREENGGSDTGVDVLRRLQGNHRKKWELVRTPKKYKSSVRPAFALDCDLPDTWEIASPEEICEFIVDCPHSTPKWTNQGEVCLRTTNFKPGQLDLTEVRYVSAATYRERIARLEPTAGDVVYSREGGILGIACVIPEGLKACLGQRMMLLRTDVDACEPRFLMHVLNSPAILSIVRDKTGGTSSPHLNVGDIRSFPIPLPSLAEQTAILQRVDSLFALAESIERLIGAGASKADKLGQSVLAKAFAGELVETEADLALREGRDYEPASVLLERIATQQASAKNGKPKRSRTSRKKHTTTG